MFNVNVPSPYSRPSYPIKSFLHLDISQLHLLQALLDLRIDPCIVADSVSINQVDRYPFIGFWSAVLGPFGSVIALSTLGGQRKYFYLFLRRPLVVQSYHQLMHRTLLNPIVHCKLPVIITIKLKPTPTLIKP